MSKFVGVVIGFLVGGFLVSYLFAFIVDAVFGSSPTSHMTTRSFLGVFIGPAAALVAAITGAVAGARIASRAKDKPADAVMTDPQQGVISSTDMLKAQPVQGKCPFCRSTTFRVEEKAGFRRCSDCHSVLPNYIHGATYDLRDGFEVGREEVTNIRRSSIGTVLTWLGGSVILYSLVLLARAAWIWFATMITDNPGEGDAMLHILWPVALAGGSVGFVMLSIGLVLHPLGLDDKK